MEGRYVGAGSHRFVERARPPRRPTLARHAALAPRTLRRAILLTLLLALACAAPAAASDVYVVNVATNNVSQYDVDAAGALTPKSPAAVDAVERPQGVAVSPDGESVYVTNDDSNNVSQYDVGAGGALAAKSPATADAGDVPRGVALSPDGKSAYVTNLGSGTVSQYDVDAAGALAAKGTPTVDAGLTPFGVAVSPDGQSVYVANGGSGTVSQYDVGADGALAAKSPDATVPAGTFPNGVAVSPDGQSVYVTNFNSAVGSDNLSQYDVGAGGALTAKSPATVPTGDGARGVAVSPNGQSAYVTNQLSNSVSQYDVGAGGALTAKSPATVPAGTGGNPFGVAVSPDGQSVYVANLGSFGPGNVSQYDVDADGALAPKSTPTVDAGIGPVGVAVRPTPAPPLPPSTPESTVPTGAAVPTEVAAGALGPPPSNEFRLGGVKRNKKRGTAKLTVIVAGPGELELAKTKNVKGQHERAEHSGKVKLSIAPRSNANKLLNKTGKAKVNPKVTFTADGGTSATKRKQIELVER